MKVLDDLKHLLRKPVELDEWKLSAQRARGEAADRLLKDEFLTEAFEAVETVYMDAWRGSAALDIDTRERAWTSVQLLGDLRNQLLHVVRTGEIAGKQLLRIQPNIEGTNTP